jgi:hypothetical protein
MMNNLDMRVRKKVDIFFEINIETGKCLGKCRNGGCINLAVWSRADQYG